MKYVNKYTVTLTIFLFQYFWDFHIPTYIYEVTVFQGFFNPTLKSLSA